MKNLKLLAYLSLLLILSACSNHLTSVRHNQEYLSYISSHKNVTILPPEVNVSSVSGSKDTRLYDYEHHLETIIQDNVKTQLENRGFKVQFLNRRAIHDKDLYGDVLRFRTSYDEVMKKLYAINLIHRKKAGETEVRVSNALPIKEVTGADLILMIDYSSFFKTSSAKTLEFMKTMAFAVLTGYAQSSGIDESATILISMIDARTGQLIWSNNFVIYNKINAGKKDVKAQDKLDHTRLQLMLKGLLEPLDKSIKNIDKK